MVDFKIKKTFNSRVLCFYGEKFSNRLDLGGFYMCCGYLDFQPRSLADRVLQNFQRLDLFEKVAEFADELYHLVAPIFKKYANVQVTQYVKDIHIGTHRIENLLHSFCFFGDLSRIWAGRFVEFDRIYIEGVLFEKKINLLKTSARVFHTTAHFLATASMVKELNLFRIGKVAKFIDKINLLSAIGYGLWTVSLIWEKHQERHNHRRVSDFGIHLGGFLFQAIPLLTENSSLANSRWVNSAQSIAGLVHSGCVINRLMPPNAIKRSSAPEEITT